jgi:hypothetical protein
MINHHHGVIDYPLFFFFLAKDNKIAENTIRNLDLKATGIFKKNVYFKKSLIFQSIKVVSVSSLSYHLSSYCCKVNFVLYWLMMLFKELHISLPTPPQLWCDNMGPITLAFNPIFHARTKHMEIDYHFTREKTLNNHLVAWYLSTHDQCVDIVTKGLSSTRFLLLCDKLMITTPTMSLRELGGINVEK